MAAVKSCFPSNMSAQNKRDSSDESQSGEDSDGNGLSREM